MESFIGTKVTTPMPDGLQWPAIAISELTTTQATKLNAATGVTATFDVTRFTAISLRVPKDGGEPYTAISTEVKDYGYRPIAMPRFSNVVGLDVTEDGEILSLEALTEKHAANLATWQANNFAQRAATVGVEDL